MNRKETRASRPSHQNMHFVDLPHSTNHRAAQVGLRHQTIWASCFVAIATHADKPALNF